MSKKLLNWDEIAMESDFDSLKLKKDSNNKKDIAIIGMYGRLGSTNNINEFWNAIINGKDCITRFPDSRRRDIEEYIKNKVGNDNFEFKEASYFDQIDKYDYNLFSISPKEAALMDPAQRIFLETAWAAIEDAGYGGKKLTGTKTGVYVGYSSTPSEEYIKYIEEVNPSLLDMAIPGNLKSIISSRISYLLDLKGPSMLIDTACSSSLVALHVACRGLRNNDCEYAIVGGIKVNIVPGLKDGNDGMGICSDSGRTKTFDVNSNGTGLGEGSAAVLLKPLSSAIRDRDNIYAVIKGTAINQDGTSIGITAPNSAAQEDVILSAWEDAKIDPNTISYIEAHGTATNLGDPIEVNGIERAFKNTVKRYQACAIGTVKTNVGHLDSVAGLAGLIKTVLALKYKKIPPNIHFKSPNKKINFIESPVYISDKLKEWDSIGIPRRAGVSSFGISGTNAHVILEEAPVIEKRELSKLKIEDNILTISAKSKYGIRKLIDDYVELLNNNNLIDARELCFVANTGRGHYSNRVAIIFNKLNDLQEKLHELKHNFKQNIESNIYYYDFKIITSIKKNKNADEITEEEKWVLTDKVNQKLSDILGKENDSYTKMLRELAELYVHGADVNWDELYKEDSLRRISIPVYPFDRKRCWVSKAVKDIKIHPLIDRCLVKSVGTDIYETQINTNRQWEIGEHSLENDYLMLGTAYVEIAAELGKIYFGSESYELKNVVFASPLFAKSGEDKEVHIIVKKASNSLEFSIASRKDSGDDWIIHSEGKIIKCEKKQINKFNIDEIISRCSNKVPIKPESYLLGFVKTSERWRCTKVIYFGEEEALAYIELDEKFNDELQSYNIYPSLLDAAANAANGAVIEGAFLPLNYSSIKLYSKVPSSFYSNIRYKKKVKEEQSIASFDITLIDREGNVFAEIEDYTIKKVNVHEIMPSTKNNLYYDILWSEQNLNNLNKESINGNILILGNKNNTLSKLADKLRTFEGVKIFEVSLGDKYVRTSENTFTISNIETDYNLLIEDIKNKEITYVIYAFSVLGSNNDIRNLSDYENSVRRCSDGVFYFTRCALNKKLSKRLNMTIVSDYSFAVDKTEPIINPLGAGLHGMVKALTYEYPNHVFRAIDIDETTEVDCIINEINNINMSRSIAFRNGKRYIEQMQQTQQYNLADEPINLKESGVYVITGGTGGIGLEIAKYLASKSNIRLALINRSNMPGRNEWENIVRSGLDKKNIHKINKIKEIEDMGSYVECICSDVSNYENMKFVISDLREKYGKINGIIHSAGVAGDGFIIRKEKNTFDEVIMPKVNGTWILDKLTENDELDFFIMCSSLTAVFGSVGQVDYTFANSFMDSYSVYRNKRGKRTLCINWPGWSETGMAVNYGIADKKSMFKAMPTDKVIYAFNEIINKRIDRVMICEFDYEILADSMDGLLVALPEQTKKSIEKERIKVNKNMSLGVENSDFNINISGKSLDDVTDTEKRLAVVWSKVLGISEIDIYDKFFEIGGDSLFATHMLKEIDNIFPNVMDVADIFIYSTIFEMAEFIDKKLNKENEPKIKAKEATEEELDSILFKLANGEISTEEAEKLIII
ncbi:MAG: beta-ketoacyl synthase family proteinphosphopantetheine-containing protein [Clostridiaceae bacterium]|jgi:polyketide synthase PksN|nr:beta-ketoacyl synthase family proteinphosphopantetheine-containing protein [Clostridiaceae bacterium]